MFVRVAVQMIIYLLKWGGISAESVSISLKSVILQPWRLKMDPKVPIEDIFQQYAEVNDLEQFVLNPYAEVNNESEE